MTDSRANGGFLGLRNLTTTGLVVVVLVAASVLGEAALTCAQISSTEPHDLGAALSVTKFLIPHLVVLALLTTGFRVAGDVAALVTSAIIFLLAMLEASLGRSETPSIAGNASLLALLQVAIIICALSDLGESRKLHPRPGSAHHINGLRFPVVTLLLAWGVVALNFSAANRRKGTKEAAYKAELDQVFLAWAQKSSLIPLLRIAQCIEKFRGDTIAGPYPRSLPQLYRWSIASTRQSDRCGAGLYSGPTDTLAPALGEDTHFALYYTPPARLQGEPFLAGGFTLEVNAVWDSMTSPLAAGRPGTRNFFLDSAGAIHVSPEHRRATARDPLLRTCKPREVDPYVQAGDCNPYQPRQRWGVKPDLPRLSLGMYNTARVHKEAYGQLLFYQASGLDSAASLVVDWSDGSKPMTVVIPRSQALGANNNTYGNFLRHIYSDTGWKFVRATIRTRAGAEYQAQDSILIKLK